MAAAVPSSATAVAPAHFRRPPGGRTRIVPPVRPLQVPIGMRLDSAGPGPAAGASRLSRGWWAAVAAAMLLVFAWDRSSGAAPVQHLYYVPIIVAAVGLGRWAGPAVAVAAVGLYHLANPALLTAPYRESDLIQIALFIGIGLVAARFARDARRLRQLSITDDLTGLYNLRGFETRLAGILRAARQARTPVSLLVLDVDRLKSLNDRHGHLTGADAVRRVGQVLLGRLPPRAVGCRFGGDEFVVALPECEMAEAVGVANDLRSVVHMTAAVLAGACFPAATLSISVGLACLSDEGGAAMVPWPTGDAEAADALFRAADRALYAAKDAGRNQISLAGVGAARPEIEG